MNLPLVNVFDDPHEVWESRALSIEEAIVRQKETGVAEFSEKIRLVEKIEDHVGAAHHILRRRADNSLERHVERGLDKTPAFGQMLSMMPPEVPSSIVAYKHSYPSYNLPLVSEDIESFGRCLHEGQILYHGGFCAGELGQTVALDRPLSTSFCPQVALRNAEWRGKAYESGELHLLVLRIMQPSPKAFVFPRDGELGNEKEVLISSSSIMPINKRLPVRNDYKVCKVDIDLNHAEKLIPAYVFEVDLYSSHNNAMHATSA